MSPLTGESFLLCLAQIGLGFAGFGGLIITLRKENTAWSYRDTAGLKFILEHSLGIVLFAFIPLLFWYLFQVEQQTWRISNALLGIFFAWVFLVKILRWRQLKKRGEFPRYPKIFIFVYLVPMALFCIIEFVMTGRGSLFWYGFGLLLLLFQAFVQFWIFLTKHMQTDV